MKIVYQDRDLIAVDKPSGLLSVPGRGPKNQDCVVSRVKRMCPEIMDQPAVHRLDMYTSGVMILTKNPAAHRHISKQFQQRRVDKTYYAWVEGRVDGEYGCIRLAFRLDPGNRPYQIYDTLNGKPGITRWRRLNTNRDRSRLQLKPLTGRTHQLRLHCAHSKGLGTPIVGDRLYGNGKEGDRMFLHAGRLKFRHPADGRDMDILVETPF